MLACAGSNVAVDNMVERLHPYGLNMVTHPTRITPFGTFNAHLQSTDNGTVDLAIAVVVY